MRLKFVDNGPGMSRETLRRAREPFFTTRAQGSGLGLAIIDRLIREAGGLTADADGGEHYLENGNIVTGTPKVLRELVKVITPIWQARRP